jgi:hypothetical protein
MFFGILNFMVTLMFFHLVFSEVVPGRIQQPVIDFTMPWVNFMVHDVSTP